MDSSDLLYTNEFKKTESLSDRQLQENANNFIPYRTLKANSVNNVRDELERTVFTDNPIVQRENKAYGWNKGGLANQRPVLSDFARDIGASSYFRYRTNYVNVDSRMRDYGLYPRPNNYKMFLGRKFDNIESIKLIDYFFPEMEYPINDTNNSLIWFTVPYEMLNFCDNLPPLLPYADYLDVVNWRTNFDNLIDETVNCEESVLKFRNNIAKSFFGIRIPPGYYTTEELAFTIKEYWRREQFFQSAFFSEYAGVMYDAIPGSPTIDFIAKPQLVNVRIDPVTSGVDFMLRYEEFEIDYLKSYIGKNYIDFRIKSEDPLVSSEEYNIFVNNEVYPIIPTGFPDIGGISSNSIINYFEFLPKKIAEELEPALGLQSYYDIVKDDGGVVIPNMIRLYLNTKTGLPILCSSTMVYKLTDLTCQKLCDARIGREAPFFLIKGTQSPLFSYLRNMGNSSQKLNPDKCFPCRVGGAFNGSEFCQVLSDTMIGEIDSFICNEDGSIKLITNLLGFLDTENALAQVGPENYAFGIIPNIAYKSNSYINTIQTYNINLQQAINYSKCVEGTGEPTPTVFFQYKSNNLSLNFKLPVCKNPNGTYSFYTDNYMFLKLLNPIFNNQKSGSQIIQVRSTDAFAGGSNDRYIYKNDEADGFTLTSIDPPPVKGDPCFNLVPSLYQDKIGGSKFLSKDVDNLFAKIKFSGMAGSCVPENPVTNEVIYFEGNVNNLDEFVVQLIDFEGKILQLNKEHSFTLMIIEKIEVLKETNINSRTNYVNSSGSENVLRNNYGM